jgi:hypothetical protein
MLKEGKKVKNFFQKSKGLSQCQNLWYNYH